MVSSDLWLGESLILGIIMIGLGLLLTLVSVPLAKGHAQASKYNYRPVQLYKLTDEERDRLGKPTAKAVIAVAMLYVLAGLASIVLGVTGNAGPVIMDVFIGTIVLSILAFLAIMIISMYSVKLARENAAIK
jgi:ABC-type antimicrobial peptide transport system permease subunit